MDKDSSRLTTARRGPAWGWVAASLAVGIGLASDAGALETRAVSESIWALERWSPYAVGIGIGVLSWLAFLLSDNTLGASGAYAKVAGMVQRRFGITNVENNAYYRSHKPVVDWGVMLLIGIVFGSFLSAWLSGSLEWKMVPDLWATQVQTGVLLRWLTALAGGILIGIGSRWARGCTSGHGISGTLQLVMSSWIAIVCFFVSGAVTALILY